MMKKVVLILLCVTIALLVVIGGLFAQAKNDVVGAWTGYAIVGDGSRFDFNFTVEKGDEGLTGKITEDTGMIPEIICRNMVLSENKLTFDIDFPNGMDLVFIKIALVLDGDTLKGFWTDPDGSSDIIALARKK
jgi:hypothetical protein